MEPSFVEKAVSTGDCVFHGRRGLYFAGRARPVTPKPAGS